ncbi:hypothetical protein HMPREF1982_01766 [Clostridiales bacterium oral taxon 876 str. F0540]|nr:hypothetical protein HMPREF1982_01766 [Clostridiales bacterium oral taxon 876 str. F0540]
MKNSKGFISPSLFGLIVICFFLPFVTVSCQGRQIAALSGIDLAFGKVIQGQRINPNTFALLSFITAVIGIFTGFLKNIKNNIISAIIGAVGFVCVLLIKSDISSIKIDSQYIKLLKVDYRIGLVLVIILFLCVIFYNLYCLYISRNEIKDE